MNIHHYVTNYVMTSKSWKVQPKTFGIILKVCEVVKMSKIWKIFQ